MKIMVPWSGGLESTYILHNVLDNSADEVIAVYYPEMHNDTFRLMHYHQEQAILALAPLMPRTFQMETSTVITTDANDVAFDRGMQEPMRPGFKVHRNHYYLRCRYATHGYNANKFGADRVMIGTTAWNKRGRQDYKKEIYSGFTDTPLIEPLIERGWARLMTRYSLPAELRAKTLLCFRRSVLDAPCQECRSCIVERFFEDICARLQPSTILQLEELLLFAAQEHTYKHLADRYNYNPDRLYDLMRSNYDDHWRSKLAEL